MAGVTVKPALGSFGPGTSKAGSKVVSLRRSVLFGVPSNKDWSFDVKCCVADGQCSR